MADKAIHIGLYVDNLHTCELVHTFKALNLKHIAILFKVTYATRNGSSIKTEIIRQPETHYK